MSSLGIRFALPYKGSNGINVVNNVISISTDSVINMANIVLSPTFNSKAIVISAASSRFADALFIQNDDNENNLYINANSVLQIANSVNDITKRLVINNYSVSLTEEDGTGIILNELELTPNNFKVENDTLNKTQINSQSVEININGVTRAQFNNELLVDTIQTVGVTGNAAPKISFDTYTNPNTSLYATIDNNGVDFIVNPE
jgi:hypothetical protein